MSLEFHTSMVDTVRVLDGKDPCLNPELNDLVQQLARMDISVQIGLSPSLREQIALAAEEPGIREFCPNDRNRFATEEKAEEWLKKRRIPATSVDDSGKLLAYDWLGPEENTVIKGADMTTAFRTTEAGSAYARSLRNSRYPDFRIGLTMGRVLILAALETGVPSQNISLETWQSNKRARDIYELLGFELRDQILDLKGRPTLHPVGTEINGYEVFKYTDPLTGAKENRVFDTRCFYQYAGLAA